MSKRLVWGDALKGLLMILVIIGHVIQYTECSQYEENHLWNAIYSFHMAAFIAVYLLLMCSENILDKEKNVLSRYIVWMGKYSLCFYTTHLLLVVSMRKMVIGVIPELDGQYALLEPLLFLLLLVVSTIIILILSRNVWLERLFIGKWK